MIEFGDTRAPLRLWRKVEVRPDGCWVWQGTWSGRRPAITLQHPKRSACARRYLLALSGINVQHLRIRTRCCQECVRPSHVEIVTRKRKTQAEVTAQAKVWRDRRREITKAAVVHAHRGVIACWSCKADFESLCGEWRCQRCHLERGARPGELIVHSWSNAAQEFRLVLEIAWRRLEVTSPRTHAWLFQEPWSDVTPESRLRRIIRNRGFIPWQPARSNLSMLARLRAEGLLPHAMRLCACFRPFIADGRGHTLWCSRRCEQRASRARAQGIDERIHIAVRAIADEARGVPSAYGRYEQRERRNRHGMENDR